MEKELSVTRLFKLFKCFIGVLLLILLAMNTVSAALNGLDGFDPESEEALIGQLKNHLPQLQQDDAELMNDLLEGLKGLPTAKWCTHCHEEKSGNP